MNYGIRAISDRDLAVALGKALQAGAYATVDALNREFMRRSVDLRLAG